MQRLEGSFEELQAAGCIQCGIGIHDAAQYFRALRLKTGGKPCDGCPVYHDGKCQAYRRFAATVHDARKKSLLSDGSLSGKYAGRTVKQIAAMQGISLNEVRRRKQKGEYAK